MIESKEEQPKRPAVPEEDGSGPHEPGVGGDDKPTVEPPAKPAVKPADSGPEFPGGGGNKSGL